MIERDIEREITNVEAHNNVLDMIKYVISARDKYVQYGLKDYDLLSALLIEAYEMGIRHGLTYAESNK